MSEPRIKFDDGTAYERMMGVWSQLVGMESLNRLSPTSGRRWIDIGCGSGVFNEQIVNLCNPQKVLGIDPSGAQIDFAKSRQGQSE